MSIQAGINTLGNSIEKIKTEIRNKGITVATNATVASLPAKIDLISNISGESYSKNVLKDVVEGTIEYLYDQVLIYTRPYCFTGCNKLKKAYFTKLTKICRHSFDGCTQFKTLILETDFVYLENINAFKDTLIEQLNGTIYVKDTLINTYKNDSIWKTFSTIIKPISQFTE